MPQIEKEYIETGKVFFEYRDFPLTNIHGSALLAAHAANCAGAQGSYWPMHDTLFAGQDAGHWGSDVSADFTTFLGYARDLKLDDKALQSCIQSNTYAASISSDYRAALDLGIQSTPVFLVNGELLVGAQPYDVWKTTLNLALARAGVQP